jgi:hypothetical protein
MSVPVIVTHSTISNYHLHHADFPASANAHKNTDVYLTLKQPKSFCNKLKWDKKCKFSQGPNLFISKQSLEENHVSPDRNCTKTCKVTK